MQLQPLADAMYKTWWSFVQYAANAVDAAGKYLYTVADVSSAASAVSKSVGGAYAAYNPIGVSQLFGLARGIANNSSSLSSADPAAPIDTSMVSEAPWSRSLAEQAVSPQWQARITMTYTDEAGVQQQGITVVNISQVLPVTVGSLQAQMALRVADQLASPPGTGTPRTGSLDSIDSITLLSV